MNKLEELEAKIYKLELERDAYKKESESLKKEKIVLKNELANKDFLITHKELIIDNAKALIAKMQKELYGSKSEKSSLFLLQTEMLFDEAELTNCCENENDKNNNNTTEEPGQEPKDEESNGSSNKSGKPSKKEYKKQDLTILPPDTPIIDVDHTDVEAPIDEKTGKPMIQVGTRSEKKITYTRKYVIMNHIFPIFSPVEDYQAEDNESNKVVVYPPEYRVLDGTMIDEWIVADTCVNKYLFGLPLYRQAQMHNEAGVKISRQNMVNWIYKIADSAGPLIDLLKKKLLECPLINMDETSHYVLMEDGEKCATGKCEVIQVGTNDDYRVVMYTLNTGKSAASLAKLLYGFNGALMTDGLIGYSIICAKELANSKILALNCWAHSRRYFFDIVSNDKNNKCLIVIKHIQKLYKIEKEMREDYKNGKYTSKEEFNVERIKQTAPVFAQIKTWLDVNKKTCKEGGAEDKAINYALNRWESLTNYPKVFEASPDNNFAELWTRSFSLGQKTWYFSDTVEGAKRSSVIFTLAQNAKLTGINVTEYFWTLLNKIPEVEKNGNWETLLPWNIDLKAAKASKELICNAIVDPNRTEPYVIRGGRY